jgi:hypothetical protein
VTQAPDPCELSGGRAEPLARLVGGRSAHGVPQAPVRFSESSDAVLE